MALIFAMSPVVGVRAFVVFLMLVTMTTNLGRGGMSYVCGGYRGVGSELLELKGTAEVKGDL